MKKNKNDLSIYYSAFDATLHIFVRFFINVVTAFGVIFTAGFALSEMDSSDFGFVVDPMSCVFGLCFGVIMYAVLNLIIDAFSKPVPDYCSKFKKFKDFCLRS